MARYSLVVSELFDPYGKEPFVVPFGKNKKGKAITKVNLEDIDIFTTPFPSGAALGDFIEKVYSVSFPVCKFEIQYIYDGEIRRLTTLVDQPFLNACAKYSNQRRKQFGKGILTDEIPEFAQFKKRVLYYMKQEESASYLLDDSAYLVPYGIKKEVKQFYQLNMLTYQTPYQRREIMDIEENVARILSNYRNTRAMVEWEQLYLKRKLKLRKRVSLTQSSIPPVTITKKIVPVESEQEEVDPDEYAFLSEEELKMMDGGEESVYWRRK